MLGQLGGAAGRPRPVELRAASRRSARPRLLPRVSQPRCCAPRSGRSSPPTACGSGSESPSCGWRIVAAGALIPVLWFGPELWGSGEPLRASSRANNPNPGSAAFAEHPGLEVVKRFHERTVLPLEALALLAGGVARVQWRRRREPGRGARALRRGRGVDRAGGVHDRARLRGQPALPRSWPRRPSACWAAIGAGSHPRGACLVDRAARAGSRGWRSPAPAPRSSWG